MLTPLFRVFVAHIRVQAQLPCRRGDLSCGLCDLYTKSSLAVTNSNTNLDFRDLPIEVSRHEVLAHQFHAVYSLRAVVCSRTIRGFLSTR
jgi:hypothetical protein